jgi:hypothetical protein
VGNRLFLLYHEKAQPLSAAKINRFTFSGSLLILSSLALPYSRHESAVGRGKEIDLSRQGGPDRDIAAHVYELHIETLMFKVVLFLRDAEIPKTGVGRRIGNTDIVQRDRAGCERQQKEDA